MSGKQKEISLVIAAFEAKAPNHLFASEASRVTVTSTGFEALTRKAAALRRA
jgi:hypothetical protein